MYTLTNFDFQLKSTSGYWSIGTKTNVQSVSTGYNWSGHLIAAQLWAYLAGTWSTSIPNLQPIPDTTWMGLKIEGKKFQRNPLSLIESNNGLTFLVVWIIAGVVWWRYCRFWGVNFSDCAPTIYCNGSYKLYKDILKM